jgi:2-hydroxychromene-2-carboxylate isomerase
LNDKRLGVAAARRAGAEAGDGDAHARSSQAAKPPLDFFFDFVSPFGWIGAEQIGAIARRFGRSVNWHPFLLKVTVLETMGLPAPLRTPLKGEYLLHDINRSLRYHGLVQAPDAIFGFSSVVAARTTLWARAGSSDSVEALVLALYRAHWSQGRDISEVDTVLEIVASLGLSRSDAAIALQGDELKIALREETGAAIRAGVFGSPTIIVDGEMFWGSDRLTMVETWLETSGW